MRLIIFLLTALWYDSPNFGQVQAEVYNSARVVPERFNKLQKRQDDLGYLEQCSILQFWEHQIGRVNVLAFFDSSWQFSHRQAAMLRVLRERFDKTGFENIQFFAINASPAEARYVDRTEIEVEEETWRQISPSEAEGLPPVIVSPEALIEALGSEVFFIQDNDKLQIWSKLRAFRDQILVIDRCGRLTYQVIVPWSILHFPYVKAAILSTYKDEPCGYCQYQESTTTENNMPSTSEVPSTPNVQTDNNDMPTLSEDSTILIIQTEHSDTPSSSEEQSTLTIQTENSDTQPITEDSSSLTTQTENSDIQSMSEESSSSTTQTENSDAQSVSKESLPSTTQTDNSDAQSISEESSSSTIQTENSDTQSMSEESSSIDQTENNDSFDTSTNTYNPTIEDSAEDDYYSNATSTEYRDDSTNLTTTTDFEPTTEVETLIIKVTDKLDIDNITEQQISETEIPTTTEMSNSSSEMDEPRLKDTDEIESLDTRDVLKSRSTNARSVSPNDGSENHLEIIEINGETGNEQNSLESDYLIPIRIIMRAPHIDEYSDQTMKAHEYLVLKTGLPEYHGHLDEGTEAKPTAESLEAEEKEQEQREEVHRPVRKKSEAIRRTFGKDESPGFYGEVADYWRNFGNEQMQGNTQPSSPEDDDQDLDQETSYPDEDITLTPTTSLDNGRGNTENPYKNSDVGPLEEIELDNGRVYDHNSDFNEEVDLVDEEAKSKLIAHYSKLLPWLYYVLAK